MEFCKEDNNPRPVTSINSYKLQDSETNGVGDANDYDDREYRPREMSKKGHSKTLKGFCSEDIKKKLIESNK